MHAPKLAALVLSTCALTACVEYAPTPDTGAPPPQADAGPPGDGATPAPDAAERTCNPTEYRGSTYDCTALDRCTEQDFQYRLACCECDPAV
jgi:hypothetical protein